VEAVEGRRVPDGGKLTWEDARKIKILCDLYFITITQRMFRPKNQEPPASSDT
jgi:hypothetical protein